MKNKCDLLLHADVVVTQDGKRRVLRHGSVAVADGVVVAVGASSELRQAWEARDKMDLPGKLLMPGLVNGHCHAPMVLLRGIADDLPLMEWLEDNIWPIEHQLTEEIIELGARLACAEMLATGTTAFLDGYIHEEVVGRAVQQSGMRAVLGEGFFGFPSPMFPTPQHCWDSIRDIDGQFAGEPRVRSAVTPHAVFTVPPEHLTASYELAEELGMPWQVHLAESPVETAVCMEKYGKRPVELLDSLGLLSSRVTLHHCVDVNDGEIALLAEKQARVVHNPASNFKLNSGMCPVQKMLDAGVVVGLGTDGAASNNQLNMFRDMGLAALMGKVRADDASAVSASSVLDMATRNSAQCLHWPELGRIEAGCPADIIALDLDAPNLQPLFNPVSQLVYATSGHEVCMTMVAGKVVYRDGKYTEFDRNELFEEVRRVQSWIEERRS
nr:amidohydrolase [Salidesulfovibrio onnuriiensis]